MAEEKTLDQEMEKNGKDIAAKLDADRKAALAKRKSEPEPTVEEQTHEETHEA